MESSRSHSIMTVYCNTATEEDDSGASMATMGKISFVDLVCPKSNSCKNLNDACTEVLDSYLTTLCGMQGLKHLCVGAGVPPYLTTRSAEHCRVLGGLQGIA